MTEQNGVERSTATETLRAMLDERDVKYERNPWSCGAAVWWRDSSGTMWRAHDNEEDELLSLYAYNSVTPEQAIEATLGRGTCRFKTVEQFIDTRRRRSDICECDRCGYRCARGFIHDERFKYCPNCGARIEVGTHERA